MRQTLLTSLILFVLFAAFLAGVQFSTPNLVDNDGYYHIKMADLMRTRGLKPEFPWLPLSVLNAQEFVDHHFFFHVLLIPFALGDLRTGAKIAAVLYPALAFLAVWWLLRGQGVPLAPLWAVGLLAISEAFIYRMSMPRAQSISLGVLALGMHWLFTKQHARLAVLAFLYVWLYNAFPLLLALAGLYSLAAWVSERRLEWKPLALAVLGAGLGLVVNPYFPGNLVFLFRHLAPKFGAPGFAAAAAARVGSEWYPYDTQQLIEHAGLALAAFVIGVIALGLTGRRMDTPTATSLFAALLFGFLLFRSRRFVEYFPPFSLAFAALAWKPVLCGWKAPRTFKVRGAFYPLLAAGVILFLALAVWLNLGVARASLNELSLPYERFAAASVWLKNNTPAGTRLFQTDWDDFPRLFFYNTHNTYTIGLDPTYMQLYDEDLYDRWVDITQGEVEHPSGAIATEFGAAYILTDLQHGEFLRQARRDPGLEEIYRDRYAAVFRLKP